MDGLKRLSGAKEVSQDDFQAGVATYIVTFDATPKATVADVKKEVPAKYKIEEVRLKITTKAGFINDVTDFVANPPALVALTGVQPGQSVEFDLSGSGTNVHAKIDFQRTEKATVGGQSVDTLVAHQTATLSGKIQGTQNSDTKTSTQYGLAVFNHTVADLTAYGIQAHSDTTSTLQKLTPG